MTPAFPSEELANQVRALRALAGELLTDRTLADDAVQDACAMALERPPRSAASLPTWLRTVVRRCALDLGRSERRRRQREQAAAKAEAEMPIDSAQQLELQHDLLAAVRELDEAHRTAIWLRFFEDRTPSAIALQLSVPVKTVKTRLSRALQLLRQKLDARHGDDRRAWLLPLGTFVARPNAVPMSRVAPKLLPKLSAMLTGAMAMMAKGKILAAAAVLVAAGAWAFWPGDGAPGAGPRQTSTAGAPVAAQSALDRQADAELKADAMQREAIAAPSATGRGDLVVRLLYGDDHSPAADVMVTAFRKNEIPRNASAPSVDSKRQRTNAEGIARFSSLRAGRTGLIADRGHWFENAHVTAGKETEVEFVMPVGVTITGIVVSATGVPVAGAEVELESSRVATTDEHGRFTVRGAAPQCSIGARAVGHGASKTKKLLEHDGRDEVRLELGSAGGIVEGIALDPDGRALANIRVDIGRYEWGNSQLGDDPPRPAHPRTDADGRFRATGIPLGEQPLTALGRGMVPWSGKCQVTADVTAVVQVAFARGNTLRGTLRDADGHPFGDVLINARAGELDWDEVINPDGTFEIEGLPGGEIEVKVDAEGAGEASARVQMVPGGAVTKCELMLVCGLVLKGRVRDELGQLLPRVNVSWTSAPNLLTSAPKTEGYTYTDKDGAFTIANVPEGKLAISIGGEAILDAHFEDLDPSAGELNLRAQRRAPKTVYIAGTVLDPDGRPAVARAFASCGGSRDWAEKATDASGYFELGPLTPGDWYLRVGSRSFPRIAFERRELVANTRWDVGTIRLEVGGDVRVEVVEGDTEGAWFSIQDGKQRWFRLDSEHGKGTSEPLPVGSYRLFADGKTLAAQSMPFEIRAGETTRVDVRMHKGVRQQFDIALPEKIEPPWGSLRIFRGADVVRNEGASREEGKPCTVEVCLEPGDYTVAVKFGELEGSATFTVGEREGEPVRIVVQQPRK
jgi:RNA polymerase sigma-70 factor (ECF subfamily)